MAPEPYQGGVPEPCRGGAPEGVCHSPAERVYQRWVPEESRCWEPLHALGGLLYGREGCAGGVCHSPAEGVYQRVPEWCRCWEPPHALGGLLCGRRGAPEGCAIALPRGCARALPRECAVQLYSLLIGSQNVEQENGACAKRGRGARRRCSFWQGGLKLVHRDFGHVYLANCFGSTKIVCPKNGAVLEELWLTMSPLPRLRVGRLLVPRALGGLHGGVLTFCAFFSLGISDVAHFSARRCCCWEPLRALGGLHRGVLTFCAFFSLGISDVARFSARRCCCWGPPVPWEASFFSQWYPQYRQQRKIQKRGLGASTGGMEAPRGRCYHVNP